VLINGCSSCLRSLSFMFPTPLAMCLQRSAKLLAWMMRVERSINVAVKTKA
jgi:hypothetical protein